MIEYQSFGAGVNSVALSEVLNHRPEKIFANTGCEYPETYDYLENYPFEITVLNNKVEGCQNIEEWCVKVLGHAPLRRFRSCTDKWKIRRIEKYIERPCIINIGIAFDEAHRIKIHKKGKIKYRYPLVEKRITRKNCMEIIELSGLKIPPKSGCWLCPFQPKTAWWRLGRNHPDLFWRAVKIDEMGDKIGIWRKPGDLRKRLWPPQTVLMDEPGWECQFCLIQI
jgi:3'-phosphoadenosine 5'-phosphosulfate sulfotransferase (PAPS reductase)/FAD synthetase